MDGVNFLSGGSKKSPDLKKEAIKDAKWSKPAKNKNEAGIVKKDGGEIFAKFFGFAKKTGTTADKAGQLKKSRKEIIDLMNKNSNGKAVKEIIALDLLNFFSKYFRKKTGADSIDLLKPEKIIKKSDAGAKTASAQMPIAEKAIEPERINLFNKLIDFWILRKKEKEIKKAESLPASPKKMSFDPEAGSKQALAKTGSGAEDPGAESKESPADAQDKKKEKKDDSSGEADKKEVAASANSYVLQTNLIDKEIISYFDWQKNSIFFVFFVFLASIAVSIIYGSLVFLLDQKKLQVDRLDADIKKLTADISKSGEELQRLSGLKRKVELAGYLLDNHIYWSNFFKFLEEKTLGNIYYSGFSGDTGGKYSLPARADSLKSVAEQLSIFHEDKENIKEAEVRSGKIGASAKGQLNSVDFNLELTVDPGIFKK